jgi:uncharacterized protein
LSPAGAGDRDRDAEGRAQNARPRDALGRPLPRGSVGVPRIPEDAEFTPEQALALGADLLAAGNAFHAHEVFEAVWKHGAAETNWLWRGLAQLSVGITHVQRGNMAGAAALLRRGADTLDRPDAPHDVDVDALGTWARDLASALDTDAAIGPDRLRLKITRRTDGG